MSHEQVGYKGLVGLFVQTGLGGARGFRAGSYEISPHHSRLGPNHRTLEPTYLKHQYASRSEPRRGIERGKRSSFIPREWRGN